MAWHYKRPATTRRLRLLIPKLPTDLCRFPCLVLPPRLIWTPCIAATARSGRPSDGNKDDTTSEPRRRKGSTSSGTGNGGSDRCSSGSAVSSATSEKLDSCVYGHDGEPMQFDLDNLESYTVRKRVEYNGCCVYLHGSQFVLPRCFRPLFCVFRVCLG